MTSPAPFQSLVDAAFAHALSAQSRASFFKEIIPSFRPRSRRSVFANALVPLSERDKVTGLRPNPRFEVAELGEGAGLTFVWRVATGPKRKTVKIVTWAELADLPCPEGADDYAVAFARQRAAAIWEKATKEFEHEIQAGRVALLGRRGSSFEDRVPIPLAALPHLEIDDWIRGTGNAAGTLLFDLAVVPELDRDTAYKAKVRAAGSVMTKLLPVIIAHLYEAGLPDEHHLSGQDFKNALERELRRLGISPPTSDRTYDRARDRFSSRTKSDS